MYTYLQQAGYILIFKPTLQGGITKIKGNVDAELVLHTMMEYPNYDKAIIVSGDGDFHCLVEYLEGKNKLHRIIRAYQAGAVKLEDFIGRSEDPRWGTMRHARSHRDILGTKEARKWQQSSNVLKAVGADVNKLALLQETRLKELHGLTTAHIDTLMQKMTNATELPRLAYHFRRHGELMGASTKEEYVGLFRQHIRRTDLAVGTALRPKDQARMWYLVGVDTGLVAQYNETRASFWTFMKVGDLPGYLSDASVWWVRVQHTGDRWVFKRWT
ncbi:MAG: NYN domain-containing protein [Chloroflexi bacterium]|nr:NYN domain-containing protein [Chloroflexota bacterium]